MYMKQFWLRNREALQRALVYTLIGLGLINEFRMWIPFS